MPEHHRAPDGDNAIREWLEEVIRATGLKATPLAKGAGLAPSTLLRALDPDNPGTLERRTIDKLIATYKVAPPRIYASAEARQPVPDEPELQISQLPPASDHLTATQGAWTIQTRALELAGYLPGDDVVADSAVAPRSRDVVVAQIIDHAAGSARTVLRVYDPPYLMTETADPEARRKPLLVDGDRVSIWGVVVRSARVRRIA